MESSPPPTPDAAPALDAGSEPVSRSRVWLRRVVLALACAPLAVISVIHTMGRTDDFGVLGKWYVMTPLTLLGVLAWYLLEKTADWATRKPGS